MHKRPPYPRGVCATRHVMCEKTCSAAQQRDRVRRGDTTIGNMVASIMQPIHNGVCVCVCECVCWQPTQRSKLLERSIRMAGAAHRLPQPTGTTPGGWKTWAPGISRPRIDRRWTIARKLARLLRTCVVCSIAASYSPIAADRRVRVPLVRTNCEAPDETAQLVRKGEIFPLISGRIGPGRGRNCCPGCQ